MERLTQFLERTFAYLSRIAPLNRQISQKDFHPGEFSGEIPCVALLLLENFPRNASTTSSVLKPRVKGPESKNSIISVKPG